MCVKFITSEKICNTLTEVCQEALLLKALEIVPDIPRVGAVIMDPPGIIMTQHSSITIENILACESKNDVVLLQILGRVAMSLQNMRNRDFFHNDVIIDNISSSVFNGEIDVTLLDVGLVSEINNPPKKWTKKMLF